MSSYSVTTTSIDVDLKDLGIKPLIHPIIALDLIAEHGCNIQELLTSQDLQAAILAGTITVNKVNVQTADELKDDIISTISGISGFSERFSKSGTFRNSYLQLNKIALNQAPYIITKDATITEIYTTESNNEDFELEIEVNGTLVSTLTWLTTDPLGKTGLSINVNASDTLEVYLRTSNGSIKVTNLAAQFFFRTEL